MISHDRGLMRAMRLPPKASLAAQGHSLEGTPPILGFTKHSHCVSYEMQLMQRPVGSKKKTTESWLRICRQILNVFSSTLRIEEAALKHWFSTLLPEN